MARKLSDVERDAMELSRQERAALVEHLLTTLEPGDDVEAEELWLEEAKQRYAEYRAGKIDGKPSEQVFREAKHKLR